MGEELDFKRAFERTAQVIVPLAVKGAFTYGIPNEFIGEVTPGQGVLVRFGKKYHTGIVHSVNDEPDPALAVNPIEDIMTDCPLVWPWQLKMWEWVASYYMAEMGQVMLAALPGSLRIQSETTLYIADSWDGDISELSEREELIVKAISNNNGQTFKEISSLLGIKTVHPVVKVLLQRGVLVTSEELVDKYQVKTAKFVRPTGMFTEKADLETKAEEIGQNARNEAQAAVLLTMAEEWDRERPELRLSELIKSGVSRSSVKTLERKGLVEVVDLEVSRIEKVEESTKERKLASFQLKALEEIRAEFAKKEAVLLHGVTASGKTEVYIELIREALEKGKQALFLLPEIALTTQLVRRLQDHFGEQVAVFHSKSSVGQRMEVWQELASNSGRFKVVIGARSSIFLPFKDLGIVVVDEEHETTYKQFDPAPRYQARDLALVVGKLTGADVVLGSATPSLESRYLVSQGKLSLVQMTERFSGFQLPTLEFADLSIEARNKTLEGHFSSRLLEAMNETLAQNKQVILFQNRRGYAPVLHCQICGDIPQCVNCDVSLTYHKVFKKLKCHYCGYQTPVPSECSNCGTEQLLLVGFGTEKVENEISLLFPEARVARLDLDTASSKGSFTRIIDDFADHHLDILIGTQMVTKGLDFEHVGLVGVLDADMLIGFPNFRAFERSFQLIEQVSGRAGRMDGRGRVIVQTRSTDHWLLQAVRDHDYERMFKHELSERRNFAYPPWYRLIHITFRHQSRELTDHASYLFATEIRKIFKNRVLGPEAPLVARVRGKYNKRIVLKLERDLSPGWAKRKLKEQIDKFYADPELRRVRIVVDVDPA